MGTSIRPDGVRFAAAALANLERRQAVLANNLANVSTAGFKGEQVFARILQDGTAPVLDAVTDLRPGPIAVTNNPLDLAIERDGFFVTETPRGERLVRSGSCRLDESRHIVDANGDALLGEDGAVTVPDGTSDIRIDRGGAVFADGKQVARLKLERVPAGTRLEHDGAGRFVRPQSAESVPVEQRVIRQGAIEESNVGSVEALVDLIDVQRAYAAAQKVLTTMDGARGITVAEIGKPG
jgi:flagellar basal-body rod protein FlgF